VVGRGSKLDNLVHIAHNARIGERVLLIAQTSIAGGVRVGDDSIVAGHCAIADHAEVGPGTVMVGGTSTSGRNAGGQILAGWPSMKHKDWVKWTAARRYL